MSGLLCALPLSQLTRPTTPRPALSTDHIEHGIYQDGRVTVLDRSDAQALELLRRSAREAAHAAGRPFQPLAGR